MKNPLIILSDSFQAVLIRTPLTEAVFIEFCQDAMDDGYRVSLMKTQRCPICGLKETE